MIPIVGFFPRFFSSAKSPRRVSDASSNGAFYFGSRDLTAHFATISYESARYRGIDERVLIHTVCDVYDMWPPVISIVWVIVYMMQRKTMSANQEHRPPGDPKGKNQSKLYSTCNAFRCLNFPYFPSRGPSLLRAQCNNQFNQSQLDVMLRENERSHETAKLIVRSVLNLIIISSTLPRNESTRFCNATPSTYSADIGLSD